MKYATKILSEKFKKAATCDKKIISPFLCEIYQSAFKLQFFGTNKQADTKKNVKRSSDLDRC